MTATTALTAQNTQGVIDVHLIPPSFVEKQITACIDDIGVDVVKTGTMKVLSVSMTAPVLICLQACWLPQKRSAW